MRVIFIIIIFFMVGFVTEGMGYAQSLSGMDISLQARDKFEWRRKEQLYVAEGSVLLKRGGATIGAERVLVYYKELQTQDVVEGRAILQHRPEIYRLIMEDGVLISSTEGQMSAKKAVYDSENQVLVASGGEGGAVKVEFSENRTIISDEVTYWIEERRLLGEGNISITGFGINFSADKVSAFFMQDDEGDIVIPGNWSGEGIERMKLDRVEVTDNILFEFDGGTMSGQDGLLDLRNKEAEICGKVNANWRDISFSGDCIKIDLEGLVIQFFDTTRELDGVNIQIPMDRIKEFVR